MRYLNLGCGRRFHSKWTNIDINSCSSDVQKCNLNEGIPFPDDTFDVVYHSHLLEHLRRKEVEGFLQECCRVLISGGIIRVVTPDLECIARTYLQVLEKVLQGEDEWRHNYEWMMLELCDQMVRERPGGAMLEYLKQDTIPNEQFVYERLGGEARDIVQAVRSRVGKEEKGSCRPRELLARIRYFPHLVRAKLIQLFLGKDNYKALQIGRFRRQGEVHHWMYDRYSLEQLLKRAGFQDPLSVGPLESRIQGWASFNLDTDPDGTVHKPDSFYMEAFKP